MAKQKQNYLDFVPIQTHSFPVKERTDGLVTVTITRRGIYDKIAQKFFHTPAQSHIDLDKYGSFVWKQIDGTRSVYEIGQLAKTQFGEESEPLYPRLVKFIAILKENRFIGWREPQS